jgi:hypothetical protein
MATRPVFVPVFDGPVLVKTFHIDFEWFPGMSVSQKQKSVASLHSAAYSPTGATSILEISSKSRDELGVSLSAFNLKFQTVKLKNTLCVECAYQGSKVFENGGPYTDLFGVTAREAKKDDRLSSSGRLKKFRFCGVEWELEPRTAFYDWLYVNALNKQPDLSSKLEQYQAFTDIEFNPERSINCQAYSVALFLALRHRNWLNQTRSKEGFLSAIDRTIINNTHQNDFIQSTINMNERFDI